MTATPSSLDTADAHPRFADARLHFVGVGGCGMSGLARLCPELGASCSGTDRTTTEITEELVVRGIPVHMGDDADTLPPDCDQVIASAAVAPDHPLLLAAADRGVPVLSYAEALGLVQSDRTGVSIAGTHGKSTTTAMLCHVLVA